jgi:YD repeat-containing protein
MHKLLTLLLLLCTLCCFSQNHYELFQQYNTALLKKQNAKIKSVTGFFHSKDGKRKVSSYREFSAAGLPTTVVEYDANFDELNTIKITYTNFGQPLLVTTFEKGRKSSTSEFHYDPTNRLTYFKEYVYSSYDGQKMLSQKTIYNYHANKKVKSIITMNVSSVLPKQDTTEILSFDTSGLKTASYFQMAGYKNRVIYQWNPDQTEMKEYDYNNDSLQHATTHKYKAGLEIERVESDSNRLVAFWKYDKANRLIQTNAALYFTQDFTYNTKGYLMKENWTATFPELVKDDFFKIMMFNYEYKFRK